MAPRVYAKKFGYVALLSVLALGAIGLSITVAFLYNGVGGNKNALTLEQSKTAHAMADACAEEALEQIKTLATFIGTGNLTIAGNNCTYAVTAGGAGIDNIVNTGTVMNVVRKDNISVSITVTGKGAAQTVTLQTSSWQEVP